MSTPFTSLSNCNFAISVSGIGSIQPTGFVNPIPGTIGPINAGSQLALGTGNNAINEAISYIFNIPAAGSATLNLLNTLTDICNQLNVPLSAIKGFLLELRSVAQDATNGTDCVSVTCGASANAWTGILGNLSLYTINNGDWWAHGSTSGVSIVAGASNLKILNNDATEIACMRFTLLGS